MNVDLIEKIEAHLEGHLTKEALAAEFPDISTKELEEQIAWVKDSQMAIEMDGLRTQLRDLLCVSLVSRD